MKRETPHQLDRIERKLDALALAIGGPARRQFDDIGWATTEARREAAKRRRHEERRRTR